MSTLDLDDVKKRMNGALDSLKKEFGGLRTGRASTALLEPITIDAYGARMPISQVASVSAPEPRMLVVQVWDAGMTKAVEKAIREANLGLNPSAEGTNIRVRLPELTEERRNELVKAAHKYAESTRVAIRNIRRDGMDTLKKAQKDGLSEDEQARESKKLQDVTDQFIKQVDESLVAKEKDILHV
jgi:ribosome recycling factor